MSVQPIAAVPTTRLRSGESVAVLGQGTWFLGEDPSRRNSEAAALSLGLDLGMTLIDTAEMYGEGAAETLVGAVIAGRRDAVFLVSKVLPQNATARGTVAACERSLRRLNTDRIDLYLLHWRGGIPLAETLEGFAALTAAGKIRRWGVSNFGPGDMEELMSLAGGDAVATDQVLYNLARRGIEWDLLPMCRQRGTPVMAYSPFDHAGLLGDPALARVAARHGVSPARIALAWVLRMDGVIAIPKSGTAAHVRDNRAALDIRLTDQDRAALDRAFPPPTRKRPLEML